MLSLTQLLRVQVANFETAEWPVGLAIATASAIPVLIAGVTGALIAVIVAHGVLRPLLEARGITPWRFRDSLGSTPLVVIGSGITSASLVALVLMVAAAALLGVNAGWWLRVLCLALLAAGVLTLRLGLLALRKLT